MKKHLLCLALLLAVCHGRSQNFNSLYNFNGVTTGSGTIDPSPVPIVTGLTFASFEAVGSPANPNAGGRFSFTNWSTGATNGVNTYASLSGSIDTSEYYEVKISPAPGYRLFLDSIQFTVQRSASGIRCYALRSDRDGFSSNLQASIYPLNPRLSVESGNIFFWKYDSISTAQTGSSIRFDTSIFQNLSAPVRLRFYAFNAETTTGTFSIDNVMIFGATNSIHADFSADTVCEGDLSSFNNLSLSPDSILYWCWDFGDGSAPDSLEHPAHFYSAPGTYTVNLIVGDSLNTDSISKIVIVDPKPQPSFTAADHGCAGAIINFMNTSVINGGSISAFTWEFGDTNSLVNQNTHNGSHTFHPESPTATYEVTLTAESDMGCVADTTMSIMIDSVWALLSYTQSGNFISFSGTGNSGSAATFQHFLDFGDGSPESFDPAVTYSYASDGQYTACYRILTNYGCADTNCAIINISTVDIPESVEAKVNVMPNPSTDGRFKLANTTGDLIGITIYDLKGSKIREIKISDDNAIIDLSEHSSGIYYLQIFSTNVNDIQKLIIDK